jgi:putative flippase GtrA
LTVQAIKQGQFWRFLAAGGAAATANFGSRFLFSLWVPYEWAIVLAFLVGLTVGFVLMRGFVFNAYGKPFASQVAIFLAVNLFALLQTFLVSVALDRWVLPSLGVVSGVDALAHLVGVLVPVVTSYFGHRMATFK